MRPDSARWVVGSLLGLALIGPAAAVRAGEPPSDRMLRDHGLKRSGALFVLEAESAVHHQAEEVRDLGRQWSQAVARQRATVGEKEYQDTIKQLTAELNQLKAQSNAATQTMNQLPRVRTRRGRTYLANNIVTEQYQELSIYRSQLQAEIGQRTAYLTQIKSQPFDPRDRIKADAEERSQRDALRQGATELRKLVDEAHAKYAEVAKDPDVKKWLDIPEGPAKVKPKLGPSRTFVLDEKLLERVERGTSDEPFRPDEKTSRKGHRTTRTKHSPASGKAASPF